MLKLNKLILVLAIMKVTACIKDTSTEDYDAMLQNEGIKRAEYEDMISAINLCINDLKHGHQPLIDDLITQDLLNDSSKVYCSDYTTTLEHPIVRYCRYYVYAEKNKNNVKSCYCELTAQRKIIRQNLKNMCDKLKDVAKTSNSQAFVGHLGGNFAQECASLTNSITSEHIYDCD